MDQQTEVELALIEKVRCVCACCLIEADALKRNCLCPNLRGVFAWPALQT